MPTGQPEELSVEQLLEKDGAPTFPPRVGGGGVKGGSYDGVGGDPPVVQRLLHCSSLHLTSSIVCRCDAQQLILLLLYSNNS